MKKQAISIFLILALLATFLPAGILSVSAASETDIAYPVEEGNIFFDKATGTITGSDSCIQSAEIPAEIEGVPVTTIANEAFADCGEMIRVSIPKSVTNIGSEAFRYCSSLESIYVDEENENYSCDENGSALLNKDGTQLLQYPAGLGCPCGYALSYTIPDSVETIADFAFYNNYMVEYIDFPASVTSIGDYAFLGCKSLRAARFVGNAPQLGEHSFAVYYEETAEYQPITKLTVYYVEGTEGWTSPTWNGYPTQTWVPEHKCEYVPEITAPTCTEAGYTVYTCSGCGDTYTEDYVPALGHEYKEGNCIRCGEAEPKAPSAEFSDIPEDAWYKLAVDYAVGKELMNGVGNGKFEPEKPMTRAMLVTVLWRYAGTPAEGENSFSDVDDAQWYAGAVAWAAEKGIVGGIGGGKFDPDGKITREQMATILYRYCNVLGIDTRNSVSLSSFPDGDKTSVYAKKAVSWAVAEGIITGSKVNGKVYLDPQGNATRAQVATILMRFIENIVK